MNSYRHVESFTVKTFADTKVKPVQMAQDFDALTRDIAGLANAVATYAADWDAVAGKVNSSDWASYADGVKKTSDDMSAELAKAGKALMSDLLRLVNELSKQSKIEQGQIDGIKATMDNCLSTLNGLGGVK